MSILWIYDKLIDPHAGGTERSTHSVMAGLERSGYSTAGSLVFRQEPPREIFDFRGNAIEDLYLFLKKNNVDVIINQIGYSRWLLDVFLARGGQQWKNEGGRIITCLHFDPVMFPETLWALLRHWGQKSSMQKIRRLGRIAFLPLARHKADRMLRDSYSSLIENSDHFVILSVRHRAKLLEMSQTPFPDRIRVIPNPNTYPRPLPKALLNEKKNIVLVVSRLDEPQKRISLVLRAWELVMQSGVYRDWKLQVLGEGEYAEDYRTFVAKKDIPNVEFIGRADPKHYYEQAALYLHCAKNEGWGLTITEAMQKGTVPIVMNSSDVFEEIIEDGQNGILSKDGDVKAFSANIAALMCAPEKRQRMAALAIDKTIQMDIEKVIQKWSDILYAESLPPQESAQ